jgi:hypothetical protein
MANRFVKDPHELVKPQTAKRRSEQDADFGIGTQAAITSKTDLSGRAMARFPPPTCSIAKPDPVQPSSIRPNA